VHDALGCFPFDTLLISDERLGNEFSAALTRKHPTLLEQRRVILSKRGYLTMFTIIRYVGRRRITVTYYENGDVTVIDEPDDG
jgi:hypothetical protein